MKNNGVTRELLTMIVSRVSTKTSKEIERVRLDVGQEDLCERTIDDGQSHHVLT